MRRALLIFVKDGMSERDVEAVARSQARKMFGWLDVRIEELVKTRNHGEVVAVVDREVFLKRLWGFMEYGEVRQRG